MIGQVHLLVTLADLNDNTIQYAKLSGPNVVACFEEALQCGEDLHSPEAVKDFLFESNVLVNWIELSKEALDIIDIPYDDVADLGSAFANESAPRQLGLYYEESDDE